MSHRDRTDLGTHLSRGENRGSYVRATDRHLSLRSFRDNNSQGTLPLCGRFVNGGSCGGEVEFAGDLDAPLDGARNGTKIGVDPQHPLYLLAVFLVGGEMESLLDPPHHQTLVLRLYLPYGVGIEVVEGNLTRCQRTPEGAERSAAGRRDEVVERGVMRLPLFGRVAVVFGDLAVDAEEDRLFLDGQIGAAHPAIHRLDPHPRDVRYAGHAQLLPSQLPSLTPQLLQGLWVPPVLSRKRASATKIRQIVRMEITTAMTTSTAGETTPLCLWLQILSNAVTQSKLDNRIIALPERYGKRAPIVSMVK
jgi:hypothetical protein